MKFPGARRIPAILRGRTGRLPVSARKKDRSEAVWGSVSLASENRFPERWEGAARDSVRMRQRPVCMQEFREELGHDGQLGTLDRIAELLYCWCAPQMEQRQQNTRALWAASRRGAQCANRPHGLSISILELNQAILPSGQRAE